MTGSAMIAGFVLVLMCATAHAGTIVVTGLGGGLSLTVHVTSIRGLKFRSVVRQHTDYSCGAAALATILDFAYGQHLSERQVIVSMLRVSNSQVVKQKGFSMLDMANYLASDGFRGAGYRVPVKALERLRVPVVVLLNIHGYEHFVVLRGVVRGRAYLADPALGDRSVSMVRFVKGWDSVVFIVMGPHYDKDTPLRRDLSTTRVHGLMTAVENSETEHLREFGVIPAFDF
ncbi:MAG TPA: C39 family peptidase [Acidiferrobacter sp.]|nr:C39 family peptidase [Acidiferrobacter sp.]